MRMNIILGLLTLLLMTNGLAAEESVVESTIDPGILPDSPFYILDTFVEKVRLGDDPQRALEYRQEKIAEAQALAKTDNAEDMKKAFEHAAEYGTVLEKEVTPEMEKIIQKVSQSQEKILQDLSVDLPQFKRDVAVVLEQEERIALAAQLSTKIKQLCETLATLDPLEYENACKKTASTQWQKKLDQKLTREQEGHARVFAAKLRECFETQGEKCDCKGMDVQSFEDICIRESSRAFSCKQGDTVACKEMDNGEEFDFRKHVPEYLYFAFEDLMQEFEESREEFSEREELEGKGQGNFNGEHRERFMQRCLEYADQNRCEQYFEQEQRGQFSPDDKAEFLPPPCTEKGITEMRQCREYMETEFGEKFPEKEEWGGKPERIEEFGRDCHALQDQEEKIRCFEDFYNEAQGRSRDDFPPREEQEWSEDNSRLKDGAEDRQATEEQDKNKESLQDGMPSSSSESSSSDEKNGEQSEGSDAARPGVGENLEVDDSREEHDQSESSVSQNQDPESALEEVPAIQN
ncbi:hypothetical protein HY496_00960 [Candidatus Woesearchaeota archaeon]|nr:hypothetical protein [Candidatus Woesearchaeota archaeon]